MPRSSRFDVVPYGYMLMVPEFFVQAVPEEIYSSTLLISGIESRSRLRLGYLYNSLLSSFFSGCLVKPWFPRSIPKRDTKKIEKIFENKFIHRKTPFSIDLYDKQIKYMYI